MFLTFKFKAVDLDLSMSNNDTFSSILLVSFKSFVIYKIENLSLFNISDNNRLFSNPSFNFKACL